MNTKEEMNKAVENLKEELRKRGKSLANELEMNIASLHTQADVLAEYQQRYNDGHITLLELVSVHESLVQALSDLLLDYTYGRAKQAYNDLDEDVTSIQNFIKTL